MGVEVYCIIAVFWIEKKKFFWSLFLGVVFFRYFFPLTRHWCSIKVMHISMQIISFFVIFDVIQLFLLLTFWTSWLISTGSKRKLWYNRYLLLSVQKKKIEVYANCICTYTFYGGLTCKLPIFLPIDSMIFFNTYVIITQLYKIMQANIIIVLCR